MMRAFLLGLILAALVTPAVAQLAGYGPSYSPAVPGTSPGTFAAGNDARFPANVFGIRKGLGPAAQDTAAGPADVAALLGTFTGDTTCSFVVNGYRCKTTGINGTPYPANGLIKSVSGAPTVAVAADLENLLGNYYLTPTGSGGGLTGITPSQVGAVNKAGDTMTGALTLPLFVMGPAQTAVGQIGQITSPYTTGMLNTQNDILRVQVGNAGPQFESGSQNPVTAGITSIMRTPAGAYSGGNTAGDAAIQAIIISDSNVNTGGNYKSGVAVDAIGGIGTSGAFVEAANTSIVNCATFSGCGGNSGLNFTNFTNIEADTNLYCMTAFQNGVCPAAGMPTGPVFGVISQLNATTQNTSNLSAFRANGSPNLGGGTVPWKIAFDSLSGAATTGISLGAVSQANGSNSQPINLTAITAAGAATVASLVEDNVGTLHLGAQGVDVAIAGYGLSTAASIIAGGFRETLTTPASSSAACTTGQFTDDANYHYVCVASNTWKRVALSSF